MTKEYRGSEEERRDLLAAYEKYEGKMDGVYEDVMCSNVLEDDERFRRIIDDAINAEEVESFKSYTKESRQSKTRRRKKAEDQAKGEAAEAMALAQELGVTETLFGTRGEPGQTKKDPEAGLAALIQQRQKGREENFLENLEAKYGPGKKSKKRVMAEPPEEAFQKNREAGRKKHAVKK